MGLGNDSPSPCQNAPSEAGRVTRSSPSPAKLGDFSALDFLSITPKREGKAIRDVESLDEPVPTTPSSEAPRGLGDFSNIFKQLGRTTPLPNSPKPSQPTHDTALASSKVEETPTPVEKTFQAAPSVAIGDTVLRLSQRFGRLAYTREDPSDPDSEPELHFDTAGHDSTSITSLSSSSSPDGFDLSFKDPVVSYQLHPNSTYTHAYARDFPSNWSTTLDEKLEPLFEQDEVTQSEHPDIADNGIHVFLDMSNIHISFLSTIKNQLNIPPTTRFHPNPALDLDILTNEIITRDRPLQTLRAGCSHHPDRSEPNFINRLRDLGYEVDVRKRKPTQDPSSSSSTSTHTPYKSHSVRYVEDLVDETLQTRIGEAFMRSFETKGTFVFVTGDAQPAKYSDGFYKSATRALRSGWHVEVICWGCSCSYLWRDLADAEAENASHRFRLIELDDFLGDLTVPRNSSK